MPPGPIAFRIQKKALMITKAPACHINPGRLCARLSASCSGLGVCVDATNNSFASFLQCRQACEDAVGPWSCRVWDEVPRPSALVEVPQG